MTQPSGVSSDIP